MGKTLRDMLDVARVKSGYGKASTATLNVLRGTNHRGTGNVAPANVDNQGITFFTKPDLNLSYDNVRAARRLQFLTESLHDGSESMGDAIRCMLSPYIADIHGKVAEPYGRSSIVDDRMAFIPLLTNCLTSLSGWPDFVLDSFTSAEGLRKESVIWADSIADNYTPFDLTANFQNIEGDPITALFAVWLEYAARVAEGTMNPYPYNIIENTVDYQTRIYRIILDPTRTFVRKIADIGVGYPTALPLGAHFNFSAENITDQEANMISIRFNCVGVRYNDPLTIYSFNRTVSDFNTDMRDGLRETTMVKLSAEERLLFNYRGYPRISELNELEWWVTKDEYERVREDAAKTRLAPAESNQTVATLASLLPGQNV